MGRSTAHRVTWLVCGLLAFGHAVPAFAQAGRAALIAAEQEKKSAMLEPEGPPPGEVIVKRILSSPLLAGSGGVYPWFGSVYNGTGFGAGLGYLRRGPHRSQLVLTGAVTTNLSTSADGRFRMSLPGTNGTVRPFVAGRWSDLNEIPYYGTGSDTTPDDRSLVDYRPRTANGGVAIELPHGFSLNGSYGYLAFSTEGVELHTRRPLPGLGERLEFRVGLTGAMLDWRPARNYAARGGFVRGDWTRYAAPSSPYSFDQYEIESAQLVPFLREQFGLAVRALATTTRTDTGDRVPFILLPSIGGGDTVRGLANRRFHDRSRVVLTGEYRWRPSRYLDMALFVDSGAVAPRLADIERTDFESGYGIGARFHGPAFTALRLDAARGREGWRFIFSGGQPF